VSQIKLFLKKYDKIYKRKKKLISDKETLISRDFLEVFYSNVMEGSYEIFQKAQQWLLFVSKEEFLTYDKAYKPMKELFKSIIEQFTGKKQRDIFEDLKVLSKDIFQNQTMLNENKKKFFKMIIKVLPEEDYPEFYPEFNKYLEFINEISDVEALYFTIQPNNKNKMQSLKERLKKLIDLYSHLFVIWFIYGNILALEEKYDKAIEIYNKALKYDQHEPTSTRLYHNLIVAHLSTGKVDDAIEIIKGLPIGIRTNPIIKSLIQHIEEKVGIELQSRV